jgi:cytochrome P450
MLSYWTSSGGQVPSFSKDTRTLSLNILAATGFRQEYDFHGSDQPVTGPVNNYRAALQTVLDNAIFLMLVPPKLLAFPLLPSSWRSIGKAAADFKQYMLEMLDAETKLLEQGSKGTGNLITSFLKALDVHQEAEVKSPSDAAARQAKGLSIPEILGNFFVINFAGHDTTANTLAFAVLLLAAHPDVQEWVGEELQDLTPDGDQEWEYTDLFPKLKRCHAVFLETLRLYPPILALPKWTNDYPQRLKVGGTEVVIPPRTNVSPSLLAVQTHPEYWSAPLQWKPKRWMASREAGSGGDDEETILPSPVPHTYFPWSDGPQNCPGAKFAQVEGVAVLAGLMRSHRIEIVRERDTESFEEAKERLTRCVEDCDMQLLLRMRNAERVKVRVRKVELLMEDSDCHAVRG